MQEVLLDISLFAFLPFCPLLGFFKRARRDSREKTSQNRLGEPRWQKMKNVDKLFVHHILIIVASKKLLLISGKLLGIRYCKL
jgi:hypothetical protein